MISSPAQKIRLGPKDRLRKAPDISVAIEYPVEGLKDPVIEMRPELPNRVFKEGAWVNLTVRDERGNHYIDPLGMSVHYHPPMSHEKLLLQ